MKLSTMLYKSTSLLNMYKNSSIHTLGKLKIAKIVSNILHLEDAVLFLFYFPFLKKKKFREDVHWLHIWTTNIQKYKFSVTEKLPWMKT